MSIYQNIFHYYRGQTKSSTEETHILQVENNVTKAFLNVLQHSSPELTIAFMEMLDINSASSKEKKFEYRYQVNSPLSKITSFAAVIGIAERKEIKVGAPKQYGIPDGAIISNEVSLLIENKIGYNSYLEQEQLSRHKINFANGQIVKDKPIIVTWKDVRNFLHEQYQHFKGKQDLITCFLLRQFEEFCIINCIGDKQKSKEYFFLRFEKLKARELARTIDSYIWNNNDFNVVDAGTSNGIGYKIVGKTKFATLTTARQRCLILHIGEKELNLGLEIQDKIDSELGIKYPRKDYEYTKYPHEAYIRLEWVENFSQIEPYINLAYKYRK
ncbi:hypothetical protein [Bacillus toyonensis]|uniref:hypothetical protein n=1 Tax=Bacillus toyonensis TaxID=155322 RepID=UPI00027942ED|nr:hypothetical protein [Bacillus toyonensis]EJQ82504.1 hypothetical protein IGK_01400 [Bacillus toyonensis]QWG97502.1 hypothetical protein EXW33_23520 [Bacillus toyonensis]